MTGSTNQVAPNPVFSRDLAVLIGVLSVLEGELMIGEVSKGLIEQLHNRFMRVGLLEPETGERGLRQALDDLNQRLRYGLGEYDRPPAPMPVPD